MLPHLLPKPRLLALAAIVLFVVVAAGLPFLGGAFLPDFQEPAVTVDTKDSTQTTRRRSQMREGHPRHPVLHYLFELGVSLKFLNGLLEVVGGIFLLFSTPESLSKLAAKLPPANYLRIQTISSPTHFSMPRSGSPRTRRSSPASTSCSTAS